MAASLHAAGPGRQLAYPRPSPIVTLLPNDTFLARGPRPARFTVRLPLRPGPAGPSTRPRPTPVGSRANGFALVDTIGIEAYFLSRLESS